MMKKRLYLCPRATFVNVEHEGLICDSVGINVRVKSLKNVNDPENWEGDEAPEEFWIKS